MQQTPYESADRLRVEANCCLKTGDYNTAIALNQLALHELEEARTTSGILLFLICTDLAIQFARTGHRQKAAAFKTKAQQALQPN